MRIRCAKLIPTVARLFFFGIAYSIVRLTTTSTSPDPEWASMQLERHLQSAAAVADFDSDTIDLLQHNSSIPNKPYYLCPTARENTSIAVTIVISVTVGSTLEDYETALNSVKCYAALHDYNVSIEYDDKFEDCVVHTDKFFRRHCHVHMLMKTEIQEEAWVLFIDGDVGIVNPNRLIEDYIEDGYEIYLYDRFYNWEYAAQYMVKNNERGRDWVAQFASYEWKLPQSFHGTDNGALHPFMMHYLVPETKDLKTRSGISDLCLSIWNRSRDFDDLFDMQACTRLVIGERVHFPEQKVKIFRKGEGWAHDSWIVNSHWSTDDLMVHAVKERWVTPYPLDRASQKTCRISFINDKDNWSCGVVFPVINRLNLENCKMGTEQWLMEGRLQVDNETRRRIYAKMAKRIQKKQIAVVGRLTSYLDT